MVKTKKKTKIKKVKYGRGRNPESHKSISEYERLLAGTSTHSKTAKIEYGDFPWKKVLKRWDREEPYKMLYCFFVPDEEGKLRLEIDFKRFKDLEDWKVQIEGVHEWIGHGDIPPWIIDIQTNSVLFKTNQDLSEFKLDVDSEDEDRKAKEWVIGALTAYGAIG